MTQNVTTIQHIHSVSDMQYIKAMNNNHLYYIVYFIISWDLYISVFWYENDYYCCLLFLLILLPEIKCAGLGKNEYNIIVFVKLLESTLKRKAKLQLTSKQIQPKQWKVH